jgi:predicted alpha/beta hydrolase
VDAVVAADGRSIAARFFSPRVKPKGAILVVPAMGVAQTYYAAFAEWLAREGFVAATFDYRGIGLSRPRRLRGFRADILDWARLDCAAMIEAIALRAPGVPITWVGHSLGGQILPFVPNRERIAKAIAVASGSGYWREHDAPMRRQAWWLWFVVAPAALALCGYFPGRRLRIVGDLPANVMRQWRRWCLDAGYAMGAEGARAQYAAVRTPLASLSFHDDEFMSERNTESLLGFYANAPKSAKRLRPGDAGVPRIGHFGFFRPAFESSLWRGLVLPELAANGLR